MNFTLIFFCLLAALSAVQAQLTTTNLTAWQHHRREKRFLIFQNGGVVKFVCGCAFPVDFQEKHAWRQLVMLMNFHYQFAEPQQPIYWWKLWGGRNLNAPLHMDKQLEQLSPEMDEVQLLLFKFAETYMYERSQNGAACLERHICENAQIELHNGLYAELLHRILKPHHTLEARYRHAYRLGRNGVNCLSAYPQAVHCLLDDYLHIYERNAQQSFF